MAGNIVLLFGLMVAENFSITIWWIVRTFLTHLCGHEQLNCIDIREFLTSQWFPDSESNRHYHKLEVCRIFLFSGFRAVVSTDPLSCSLIGCSSSLTTQPQLLPLLLLENIHPKAPGQDSNQEPSCCEATATHHITVQISLKISNTAIILS